MQATDIFEWLEASPLAAYIRQSHLLYPVLEIIHIIGFVGLVGSAFLFDLRLLGLSTKIRVTHLAQHLLPWSRRSLWLVLPAGLLLFISQATELSRNRYFGIKLALIVLAFANAAYFHRVTLRNVSTWDHLQPTPTAARIAGMTSIVLWVGVITCGRFLAYFE